MFLSKRIKQLLNNFQALTYARSLWLWQINSKPASNPLLDKTNNILNLTIWNQWVYGFPFCAVKNCAQWASHHRDWWSSRPVLTSTPSSVSMSDSITFNSLILESIFIYYGPSVLPCDPRCHFTVNWFQLVLHNMTYHMSNWIPALSPVLQFN